MPPDHAGPTGASAKLVVVTGSGRSGTSTVAGTLKKLGSYVPQPEIPPNDANPRGYFEPTWVVAFDKKVLAAAAVRTLDGRPFAADLMRSVQGRTDFREELRTWLAGQLLGDQIVVKDPRIVWLRDMYAAAAHELGVEATWLTTLRHPAEVVGSREKHYLTSADAGRRLARETANLAGWVNVGLLNEHSSRGDRRVFIHYRDMIDDWRTTMGRVADRLGLSYDVDLSVDEHHEVDDFIDAGLRRVQATLGDLDVPSPLRDLAETVWRGLDALSRDPHDTRAMSELDDARATYDQLFVHSMALVQDATESALKEARQQVRRQVTRRLTGSAAGSKVDPTPDALPKRAARRLAREVRRLRGSR